MSLVPLMFRDWWDEFDTGFPMRTSRLLDQHFGTGLKRDELVSSFQNSTPSSLMRHGYFRPWRNAIQRQESGSTINMENDKFQVILDVQQFKPDEITVKTNDKYIIVEGKHEEKQDEHGFISRHFVRRYQLPEGHESNDVVSSLSSDGILTVSSPKKALPPPQEKTERVVPIQSTGQPAKPTIDQAPNSPKVEQMS